jgi:phospholipase/lecithinase/hemolysin
LSDTLTRRAPQTTITDYTTFWQAEMAAYFSAVTLAHMQGGMKTHLFINVPPDERSPANAANATKAAKEKSLVDGFNAALKVAVAEFAKEHKDAVVLSYDAHAFFTKVLDAPAKYGFKNVTGYCTCDDDSYFWYSAFLWLSCMRKMSLIVSSQILDTQPRKFINCLLRIWSPS